MEIEELCETNNISVIKQEFDSQPTNLELLPDEKNEYISCNIKQQDQTSVITAKIDFDLKTEPDTDEYKKFDKEGLPETPFELNFEKINSIKQESCDIFEENISEDNMEFFKKEDEQYDEDKDCLKKQEEFQAKFTELEVDGKKMLQCAEPGCEFKARFKSFIKRHSISHLSAEEMKKYFGEKLFHCPYEGCDFTHIYKSLVERHSVLHKNDDQIEWNYCKHCPFKTKHKSSIREHLMIHKNSKELRVFKCTQCSLQTIRKSTLNRHMLLHKSADEIDLVKCELCDFQTKHKRSLPNHYQVKHNIVSSSVRKREIKEKDLVSCPHCNYRTLHKSVMEKHSIIHKDPNEVEMHKCPNCSYQTIHKRSLKSHQAKHIPPDQQLQCSACPFRTKYQSNLRNHTKLYHKTEDEVEVYQCEYCSYRSRIRRYIRQHVAKVHKHVRR